MTPNVFFFSLFFDPSANAAGAGVDGLSEGDLVISEFMANPRSARSAVGEWIEIHNPTSQDIDLQGLTVVANGSFTVNQSVTVSAGGYAILAPRNNSTVNGGLLGVDYTYSYTSLQINNRTGTVAIRNSDGALDAVSYSIAAGFPAPWGATFSLDLNHLTASDNDLGYRWCGATSSYGRGDRGTPGADNDACPAPLLDLGPGSLVVSEVMTEPSDAQERYGEWFEIVNTASTAVDLYQLTVTSGTQSFTLPSHLYVQPGEAVLLAAHSNASLNGGLTGIHYTYSRQITLDNEDSITLSYGDTIFDVAAWDADYTLFAGYSLSLDSDNIDADSNDESRYWCAATSAYGSNMGTPGRTNDRCLTDNDGDGVSVIHDCDDTDPDINPFATEVCDGADNDCDGDTDEGVSNTYFQDADGDGYGLTEVSVEACAPPSGYATVDGDCNDLAADLSPGSTEVCDDVDNDCDGSIDEFVKPRYYQDADGDGYGDSGVSDNFCAQPEGWVSDSSDCDDSSAVAYPGNTEVCDNVDNDCDGSVDEFVKPRYYQDADGDGYGDPSVADNLCAQPEGWVSAGGDCDDASGAAYPGADEACDEIDNDCDGEVDEGALLAWYADADGDGYGNPFSMTEACTPPSGHTDNAEDCDDSSGAAYPGADEACDEVDNDCDGQIDEDKRTWYADADTDGYGDPDSAVEACEQPEGYILAGGDCDDTNSGAYLDAVEVCDGIDNNCDGQVDEDIRFPWFADVDGDGFGDMTTMVEACEQPSGYIDADGDCDDTDSSIHPMGEEVCDEVDNDCDGDTDEDLLLDFYPDTDGDGYGDGFGETVAACTAPSGYAESGSDCDDTSSEVYPGADELCDGIDNDCNGETDTDADATTYALTLDQDQMLRTVHTETGEITTHSGPYTDVGTAQNAIAGSPISGRLFIHNNSERAIYELDPSSGTASEVLSHSISNVCGLGLTDDENLYALSSGDDSLYFFDLDAGTTTWIGELGQSIHHCGLVYSNRNQALYGITVNGADNSWLLRIDTETGAAQTITQLSTDHDWSTAGMTYDELTDTIYVVSKPGIFQVDLNPSLSGGDNVTLITDEISNDNLSFFATSRNASRFYTDADGDGYGDPSSYVDSCSWPEGTVTNAADCADGDAEVHPDAEDLCDGTDNDCDNAIDEDAPFSLYYTDADGDGYGDADSTVEACEQPEGTTDNGDDPNDDDESSVPEVCDGLDNDGDGVIDNGFERSTWYTDADGDGYGDPSSAIEACEQPEGTTDNADDCDDSTDTSHPGAVDVCDGADNDCDTDIDEDALTMRWHRDADGDGYGDAVDTVETCAQPDGYTVDGTDCDDSRDSIYPDAAEDCDGLDNDCDEAIDEGLKTFFYADVDADGYGDPADAILACEVVDGYVTDDTDCDDSLPSVNPGMEEACDELDNNCNDEIDEGALLIWHADLDRDTHGDPLFTAESCAPASIFDAESSDDCDDRDADTFPGADEVCDEADNDCDDEIDEGLTATWFEDDDGDGHGDAADALDACAQPAGYVESSDDCDDRDGGIFPGADEVCDALDNDCDDEIDEGVMDTWYADGDGDGYGNRSTAVEACEAPDGYVSNGDDCNDCDDAAWQEGTDACEACDCEDFVTYYADEDGDGYGNPALSVQSETALPGFVENSDDCDDQNGRAYPDATEVCDGADNNCNGDIDEGFDRVDYYTDADGDGYGDAAVPVAACEQPDGTVENPSDPDDSDADISPEICDGIDNDGDGEIDEALLELDFGDETFASDILILSGDAEPDADEEVLSLVTAARSQRGSAMVAFPVPGDAWRISFEMFMGNGSGADGLGLIILDPDESNLLGESGGGLGVRGLNGYTVEFDTYHNGFWGDPNENHVALIDNRSFRHLAINDTIPELEDTGWKDVEIVATEDYIVVYLDGDRILVADRPSDLPDDVMLGLSAATGAKTNDHLVDNLAISCPTPEDEEPPCEEHTFYEDWDGDGYGNPDASVEACEQPSGTVDNDLDCDDNDPTVSEESTFYGDMDADGYGNPADAIFSCGAPDGYVTDDTDCDDSLSSVNPGMEEACDELDNNCNDEIDEGVTLLAWLDEDRDQHGHPLMVVDVCAIGDGMADINDDCDDRHPKVYPGAAEACDERDNDCDGDIDEGVTEVFYADSDIDSYGDWADSVEACTAPEGYVSDSSDCDDSNSDTFPGAPELCNELDDDCDGLADNGLPDQDGSGVADCREVAILVTERGALRGMQYGCEGQKALERELDEIADTLDEMGLGMVTFIEGEDLNLDDLSAYPVIVYHNMGWARQGDAETVQRLASAAEMGKGLVLMGDDLAFLAARYSRRGEDSLMQLAGLEDYHSNGSRGLGTERADTVHPVIDGPWGTVTGFPYVADIDKVTLQDRGTTPLLYLDGTDYPAAWAKESFTQRTAAITAGLYTSHDCRLSDPEGLDELRSLFQNAVWWVGRY